MFAYRTKLYNSICIVTVSESVHTWSELSCCCSLELASWLVSSSDFSPATSASPAVCRSCIYVYYTQQLHTVKQYPSMHINMYSRKFSPVQNFVELPHRPPCRKHFSWFYNSFILERCPYLKLVNPHQQAGGGGESWN